LGAAPSPWRRFSALRQQWIAGRIVGQTFLRKDADFEIDSPSGIRRSAHARPQSAQADTRIDLDMGPHPGRAMQYRLLDGAPGARAHVLDRKGVLDRPRPGRPAWASRPTTGVQRSMIRDLSRWICVSTKPAQTSRPAAS